MFQIYVVRMLLLNSGLGCTSLHKLCGHKVSSNTYFEIWRKRIAGSRVGKTGLKGDPPIINTQSVRNKVMSRIFGIKREEVAGDRKMLFHADLHGNQTLLGWPRRICRVGHVSRAIRNSYIIVRKHEGNKPLGRPRHRKRMILKWILKFGYHSDSADRGVGLDRLNTGFESLSRPGCKPTPAFSFVVLSCARRLVTDRLHRPRDSAKRLNGFII